MQMQFRAFCERGWGEGCVTEGEEMGGGAGGKEMRSRGRRCGERERNADGGEKKGEEGGGKGKKTTSLAIRAINIYNVSIRRR